jgi:CRISPR-associated protein Cas2
MINRFMRVFVFFDLPVYTKKLRKEYAKFRKFLINDGFFMLQYSVYTKIARNHDDANQCILSVKRNLPAHGSVRLLSVTEKQYAAMQILVGEATREEDFLKTKEILEF